MKNEDNNFLTVIFLLASIIAFVLFMNWFNSYECHSRWDYSGMEVSYGFVKGCTIKNERGWIPAANYREI